MRRVWSIAVIVAALCLPGWASAQTPGVTQLPFAQQARPGTAQQPGAGQQPAPVVPGQAATPQLGERPRTGSIDLQQAAPGQQLTSQQLDAIQGLSGDQKRAISDMLKSSGGSLPPQVMEMLKEQAEARGMSAEEVLRAKDVLERREGTAKREADRKLREAGQETGRRISDDRDRASLFDRIRKVGRYQDISLDLKPFGYDFFLEGARVASERRDVPIPASYVVGPGDEVRILLWGRVNAVHNVTVERNGTIFIPQIGSVAVGGLTFEEMSKRLVAQANQIVGANIDVTMGALRSIPIFVLGDVKRPGTYTISAFATVTDALIVAGGPSEIGSLRNVQVRRNGRLATTFDAYELLLKGDKSKDLVLHPGDVVFVPVVGRIAGIAGNVRRPAIYELKEHHDINAILELAGGILPTAYIQQIQVERIVNNERQIVIDFNDKDRKRLTGVALQDGDLVKVFNIVDRDANAVFLEGHAKRPGKYEFKEGMRASDLVRDYGDLLPETYLDYAVVRRLEPKSGGTRLVPFNLGRLLAKVGEDHDVELQPQDIVTVFSIWDFRERPMVTVEGEVRGVYAMAAALGMKKSEMIPLTTEDRERIISLMGSPAISQENRERLAETLKGKVLNAEDRQKLSAAANSPLMTFEDRADLLSLLRAPAATRRRGTLAEKDVTRLEKQPDTIEIPLRDDMRVRDAILASGGLTTDAYFDEMELYRTEEDRQKTSLLRLDLKRVMAGDPAHNVVLKDLDRVVVKSVWGFKYRRTVTVEGEVYKPGVYQYADGMRIADLIFAGGNVLESAYLEEGEITSQELDGGNTVKTTRRVVNLAKALKGDGAENVALRPYDVVTVKKYLNWRDDKYVFIRGEVKFPGKYYISSGEKLSSLIERAGGLTERSYPSGSVFTRERVKETQKKMLEELIMRTERQMSSASAASLATAATKEAVEALALESQQKRQFIETLKKLEPLGRMAVRIGPARLLRGSEFDIELEGNDSLFIPTKSNAITVAGSVMTQGSFLYIPEMGYKDYIELAGGYSDNADKDSIYVIKADGTARKAKKLLSWNEPKGQWEISTLSGNGTGLDPGDSIIVPEKLERIAWLREFKDITQILMNSAVVAGVVIQMFK